MESYFIRIMETGEWKWLAVVGIGVLIVAITLLVSLMRGINWAALLALIFGGGLVGAPILLPAVVHLPEQKPQQQVVAADPDAATVRALAIGNQQTTNDLTAAVTEIKIALDALTPMVEKLTAAPAPEAGGDGAANTDAAANGGGEAFAKQIAILEEAAATLAKSLAETAAQREKLQAEPSN